MDNIRNTVILGPLGRQCKQKTQKRFLALGWPFFSHMVLDRLSALGLAETAGGFRVCTGLPFMVAASGFPNSDTGTGTQTTSSLPPFRGSKRWCSALYIFGSKRQCSLLYRSSCSVGAHHLRVPCLYIIFGWVRLDFCTCYIITHGALYCIAL